MEEGNAGANGETVAGEAVREVAEEFDLEGCGDPGVIHG